MLEEITNLLGLSEYPGLAVVVTCVSFIFLLYSMIAIVSTVLKRVGGWK